MTLKKLEKNGETILIQEKLNKNGLC
jgi:hypothetical protein